jgi:hypothetical protein
LSNTGDVEAGVDKLQHALSAVASSLQLAAQPYESTWRLRGAADTTALERTVCCIQSHGTLTALLHSRKKPSTSCCLKEAVKAPLYATTPAEIIMSPVRLACGNAAQHEGVEDNCAAKPFMVDCFTTSS